LGEQSEITITKKNQGRKINEITIDGKQLDGYFVSYDQLKTGKELIILAE
jgi:hypothetical protein